MYYVIYVVSLIFLFVRAIGEGGDFRNYFDYPSAIFVLAPCILILFGTKSLKAFGRSVLFAFGKRDYSYLKYRESLQAVKMVMLIALVSGVLGSMIGMVNGIRGWKFSSLPEGIYWRFLDASVAVLTSFYALLVCLLLLPLYFMLKKYLTVREAVGEPAAGKGEGG